MNDALSASATPSETRTISGIWNTVMMTVFHIDSQNSPSPTIRV